MKENLGHSELLIGFQNLKTIEDLAQLLNEVEKVRFGQKYSQQNVSGNKIKSNQIAYYANPNWSKGKRYYDFQIPKKTGGLRSISSPTQGLKRINSNLSWLFYLIGENAVSEFATGYRKGKSIKDNAIPHINKEYVFNLDLKDFFHSIELYRVKAIFRLPPFNLLAEDQDFICFIMANLCCKGTNVQRTNKKGEVKEVTRAVLPQGAPTSPIISNLICRKLDKRISKLAKSFGISFTRYVDDITFSSDHFIYSKKGGFLKKVFEIIEDEGFRINSKKVYNQPAIKKQQVTGLIVNEKANVPKTYLKEVRKWLYYWERYGLIKAQNYYQKEKNGQGKLENVLGGKLDYLKMIKGEFDPTYLRYYKRYYLLNNIGTPFPKELDKKILIKKIKPQFERQNYLVSHKPDVLAKLLKMFAQDDRFKYTTHAWDPGMSYRSLEEFVSLVQKSWISDKLSLTGESLDKSIRVLRPRLATKIGFFLTKKDLGKGIYWGPAIKIGWGSTFLDDIYKNQLKNRVFVQAHDIELPEEYQFEFSGRNINLFSQVINIFKNEIEIRTDEQARDMFKVLNEGMKAATGVITINPYHRKVKGISAYTDVEYLITGIQRITQGIVKRKSKGSSVSINCLDDNPRFVQIEIIHNDSFPNMHLRRDGIIEEKFTAKGGDFKEILYAFENVCDWSVECKFKDGNFRINYLASEQKNFIESIDQEPVGFKHILKLYRGIN